MRGIMLGVRATYISLCLIALSSLLTAPSALARDKEPRPNVCTISLDDSKKEIDAYQHATKNLLYGGGKTIELTPSDDELKKSPSSDWFSYACQKATDQSLSTHVHCDSLIIVGHYNGGFFGKRGLSLSKEDL